MKNLRGAKSVVLFGLVAILAVERSISDGFMIAVVGSDRAPDQQEASKDNWLRMVGGTNALEARNEF